MVLHHVHAHMACTHVHAHAQAQAQVHAQVHAQAHAGSIAPRPKEVHGQKLMVP